MSAPAVGVTGANGYVGGVVMAALRAAGLQSVGLSSSARHGQRPYSLGAPLAPAVLDGLVAVVHAAHDFGAAPDEVAARNVAGSRPLLEAARARGVRVVLVSSLSAFDGCRSSYGQAKLALEREVRAAGGRVFRAGVVHGDGAGGIVGSLRASVGRLPVTPVFAPHSTTYVSEADALGRLAVHLATADTALGSAAPVLAAADRAITFLALVRALAGEGRRVRTVRVPVSGGLLALRTAERLGVPVPFRSDSLVALAHPIPADQVARLERSPIAFPDMPGTV